MDFPDTWPAVSAAVAGFLIAEASALPAETQAHLVAAAERAPVDRLTATAEALYAVADAAGPAAQTLAAQLASFVVANFQHLSMADEPQRGHRMIRAMRRRLGELDGTQAPPAEDPAPRPEYVPAA